MSKKVFISIGAVVLVVILGAVLYILRPTAEASKPIEAVAVEIDQPTASIEPVVESDTVEDKESNPTDGEETTESEGESMTQSQDIVVFTIIQEESEVRFTLDELLRGNPKTVVGITDQVAGEIVIDPDIPKNSQVGTILVNARTLVTDSDFRNRAIKNEILDTGDYEFITFTPTSISDFPDNPQIGEELVFKISGNLTIRDIIQEVIFDVRVTVNSETNLTGYASTMVARADFDLTIPEVPNVANVDEEVFLEIEFTAVTK